MGLSTSGLQDADHVCVATGSRACSLRPFRQALPLFLYESPYRIA